MQPNTKLYMHPRIGYRIYSFLFESQKKKPNKIQNENNV